jgi:hypothetical protein
MAIEFLLQRATRGDSLARDIAAHALRSMSKGGMYDVVGGGFARYSTDDQWLIPHFEKMLYDNAQLALTYLHAWLVTNDTHFQQVCEETLDFLIREMTHPLGGFYSSLDADSEGKEGKFYVWTTEEIKKALKDPQKLALFSAAYKLTGSGNFEGEFILQRELDDEQLAAMFGLPIETVPEHLKKLHNQLLIARSRRIRPGTDDKILVAWNALALAAFGEAGRYLERADYLTVAQHNAHFILHNLIQNGRLLRSWRDDHAKHNAYLEDYAALILGLLALYQSDPNLEWYTAATSLAKEMLAHFTDPNGGFFDTRDDHEKLLLRPKDEQDNATPSGNALAACALLRLAAYEGNTQWRKLAEQMLGNVQESMVRFPTAYSQWLQAADFAIGPVKEIAVIGDTNHPQTQHLINSLWDNYQPLLIAAISAFPPGLESPALLQDRPMLNDLPTAYVCQGFICLQPTNSAEDVAAQIKGKPSSELKK